MTKNKQEILRFLFVGFGAVAIDLGFYKLLINYINVDLAKTISFLLGTIWAYILNNFWTFSYKTHNRKIFLKFLTLYTISLLLNVAVNHVVLAVFTNLSLLAFLCATAVSTITNFLGQKQFVFKQ